MSLELAAFDLLAEIRRQNLGAYEKMPSRIDEDVSQESQIAEDYNGRLVFELLQNADDAMTAGGFSERISFRLTDEALTVANSGRPLSEADVRGLCGTGLTGKRAVVARRRASIGHKGMGFKSVLEVTDRPEVFSTTVSFRLGAEASRPAIDKLMGQMGLELRARLPTMRLPWPAEAECVEWQEAEADGLNVMFRFPLRETLTAERRGLLAKRLLEMPITTVLFLKHLDDVEVDVRTSTETGHFRWRVARQLRRDSGWEAAPGFGASGVYRVRVTSDEGTDLTFVIAHDADVEIGAHTGGLGVAGWDGIELSEVSVASRWPVAETIPTDWARFHVFLPTAQASPYPLLVNGAFRTDLARQEIRLGDDDLDYNRHLLQAAAAAFRDRLLPVLNEEAVPVPDILGILDRTRAAGSRDPLSAAGALHDAFRKALAGTRFVPSGGGKMLALSEMVVPPVTVDPELGAAFRSTLSPDAGVGDRRLPIPDLCASQSAGVLADLGACILGAREIADALAKADPTRARLRPHPEVGEKLMIDPVLDVMGRLWAEFRGPQKSEFERAVRELPLFPEGIDAWGFVRRARSDSDQCFYPPRGLVGEIPLRRLKFMLQQVCWGNLTQQERGELLHAQMPAWQALFGIREFRFPDVMRASVLPALELDPPPSATELRADLQSIEKIAAICQLAGRTTNKDNPLPYERFGSNLAVFHLSRLRVPCRRDANGVTRWEPAYRVYLGRDWIGDTSIEIVLDAVRERGVEPPLIPLLAPPKDFGGHLARYAHLENVVVDETASGSIEELDEEDAEGALESSEQERWLNFLVWLGVNRVLRPVSFHDVEDRGTGWLSTAGLTKPQGSAFANLRDVWGRYASHVRSRLGPEKGDKTRYFYGLHDLDHIVPLLLAARGDLSGGVGRALFAHLAHGWQQLNGFAQIAVAVTSDHGLSKRTPPKPRDEELRYPTYNFWVRRLRTVSWIPTTHGPRLASSTWIRSAEVDRRFGRRGFDPGKLLPLLSIDDTVPRGRAEALAQLLGIRAELGPATFHEPDAKSMLAQMKLLFGRLAADGELEDRTLRDVVRPAYRNLLELMTGAGGDDDDDDDVRIEPSLGDEAVLVHDGTGNYRFVPGREAWYMERSGTRERLGRPPLDTFVLETSVTSRRALRQLGIRTLEQELEWTPEPGIDALDEVELEAFHAGLNELAPYVLARLRADRGDDRLATRDASRLRSLLSGIRPVETLSVGCRLDDRPILEGGQRNAWVGVAEDGSTEAYVRWGERGWPPSAAEADALATALVDSLGVSAFEAFLALTRADASEARQRLLLYAGAPTNLKEFRDLLFGPGAPKVEPPDHKPEVDVPPLTPEEAETLEPGAEVGPSGSDGERPHIPLFRPEDLLIDGIPDLEAGIPGGTPGKIGDSQGGPPGGTGHRGGRRNGTYLDELNQTGMWVALHFERHRLRLSGHRAAEIFVAGARDDDAFVFDVSTKEAIAAAKQSTRFCGALVHLERLGLSVDYPGFDILTIDTLGRTDDDRLIELKSSGFDARVQEMTWNEWKTARDSRLRASFYLYLVSNLRSDLEARAPYLRAIRDPFGSLMRQELVETSVVRTVQLNVRDFDRAEHLEVHVRRRGAASAAPEEAFTEQGGTDAPAIPLGIGPWDPGLR